MGLFKSAAAVAAISFRRWLKDIRVRCIILIIGYMLYLYITPFTSYGLAADETCSVWFLPNLFKSAQISVGASKVILHIGMLLLLCDAPFLSPVSPYIILRSRRDAWWIGECLYIIGAAFVYALFVTVLTIILLLPAAEFGNEWGGVLEDMVFGRTDASAEAAAVLSQWRISISPDVIRYLYPQGSQIYVFAAAWCSFSFLGLLVYLISLIKRNVLVGMSAAALFILWDPFMTWLAEGPALYWMEILSPVTWTSIDQMDVANRFNIMSVPLALGLYIILITVLIVLIARCSRKTMIEVV